MLTYSCMLLVSSQFLIIFKGTIIKDNAMKVFFNNSVQFTKHFISHSCKALCLALKLIKEKHKEKKKELWDLLGSRISTSSFFLPIWYQVVLTHPFVLIIQPSRLWSEHSVTRLNVHYERGSFVPATNHVLYNLVIYLKSHEQSTGLRKGFKLLESSQTIW